MYSIVVSACDIRAQKMYSQVSVITDGREVTKLKATPEKPSFFGQAPSFAERSIQLLLMTNYGCGKAQVSGLCWTTSHVMHWPYGRGLHVWLGLESGSRPLCRFSRRLRRQQCLLVEACWIHLKPGFYARWCLLMFIGFSCVNGQRYVVQIYWSHTYSKQMSAIWFYHTVAGDFVILTVHLQAVLDLLPSSGRLWLSTGSPSTWFLVP